ncbi:MAG: glycerophosphodiester phosphodiesterase family protein [Armatimonadia bacterium]
MTYACAHRGDNYCAPENTLPAFELALEKGAPQIEFDLRVTADEEIIVLHDEKVDRTTNGSGKTTDLTFAQIRALDAGSWKDARFAGTKLPTFDEILALVPSGVEVNVQTYLAPQYIPQVIERIKAFNLEKQCFLAANKAQIDVARATDPSIRICNLEGQRSADSDYPDLTIAMGAEYIQICGWSDNLAEATEKLHQHNIKVNWFGTSEADMMRKLIKANVDYILTDHLDLCLQVLAE